MSSLVYIPSVVKQIKEFYGELLMANEDYPIVRDHLKAIALKHFQGVQAKEDCVFIEMNNYHPEYIGKSVDQLKSEKYSLEDSKNTIAYEYGFKGWNELKELDFSYNIDFEKAKNKLLLGQFDSVKKAILDDKNLLTERSKYGHRATLLHYCGNNGVELWRQQVPSNLAAIISLLLTHGADKNATMSVYGGEFDTLSLLSTSAHPKEAGIMEELVEVLS